MIEYALLFGLGFLSASLLTMLLAPAVHGRIVKFTENRLRATMPLSPAEIRAQKDMARAAYAAENARTAAAHERERARADALQIRNDELAKEASRILAESQDLAVRIETMAVEAADLRSQLRRDDTQVTELQEALKRAEETAAAKDLEIESLMKRLDKVAYEIDNLKIERSTRMTEIEDLKMRMQNMRDERESLKREHAAANKRARDAEQRLMQEEHQRLRLDDRLVKEMAGNADKDAILDRRAAEIARLKDRLKQANADLRRAARGEAARPGMGAMANGKDDGAHSAGEAAEPDYDELAEDVRHQYAALAERLNRAKSAANDEALREEIADLAANMIVLTAGEEGANSPIPQLIAANEQKPANGRRTLAERARAKNPKLR